MIYVIAASSTMSLVLAQQVRSLLDFRRYVNKGARCATCPLYKQAKQHIADMGIDTTTVAASTCHSHP